MIGDMGSLKNAKQEKVCQAYVLNGHKMSAAYREGFDTARYTSRSVNNKASQFFKLDDIRCRVSELEQESKQMAEEKFTVDAEWVLRKAKQLADFNIKKFIVTDDDGNAVYDFSTATDDDWWCISEYSVKSLPRGRGILQFHVEEVKIKTPDKIAALKLLGSHVNVQAFKENVDHSGTITNVQMSAEEYKAARQEMMADDEC